MALNLLALWGLLSCGLETFYYIDYIPLSDYFDNTRSSVRLPSSGSEGYGDNQYFTHFIIFYRIYLSDNNLSGRLDSSGDMLNSINPTLLSDFNWATTYTNTTSTTVTTSNLEGTFFSRRYYKLEVEGARIDNVLGSGARGNTLEIRFNPTAGQVPELRIGSLPLDENTPTYMLQRADPSNYGFDFIPQPENSPYFFNHPELLNTENATQQINADVVTISRGDARYTYVSMYIAAVGRSFETPPTTIYSQPTFLGIFTLPER
jgi:hypothetical protein